MHHVVLSPGSRSTPLTVAALDVGGLTHSVHLDERTAAFVALGRAKATGTPVGLICTSGTAAANHLPAIAEAGQARVPIVVMTADRPPELQDWGAGQTFDQTHLFGSQVAGFFAMPVGADAGLDHAIRAGWRATERAATHPGPVHVNWPFRLPLEPTGAPREPIPVLGSSSTPTAVPAPQVLGQFADLCGQPNGIIVAGPFSVRPQWPQERDAVHELARRTGWPIVADVLSGLRDAPADVVLVDAADSVLTCENLPAPSVVVRLGDTPTAKSVRLWWERTHAGHVLIDPLERWQDPSHQSTAVFRNQIHELLSSAIDGSSADPAWGERWQALGSAARHESDTVLDAWPTWTEAHLARDLGRHAPEHATIVVSSSMPVRDLDSFGSARSSVTVHGNRGVNGIDGIIATATGVSQSHPDTSTIVLIGDVALLHDVGSVLGAARSQTNMTIVVPNNDGGGIFSFLPIRDALPDAAYDEVFHTPHGTTFSFLAGHPGISHQDVDSNSFADALRSAVERTGVTILEAAMDTPDSVAVHRAITAAVKERLA